MVTSGLLVTNRDFLVMVTMLNGCGFYLVPAIHVIHIVLRNDGAQLRCELKTMERAARPFPKSPLISDKQVI